MALPDVHRALPIHFIGHCHDVHRAMPYVGILLPFQGDEIAFLYSFVFKLSVAADCLFVFCIHLHIC